MHTNHSPPKPFSSFFFCLYISWQLETFTIYVVCWTFWHYIMSLEMLVEDKHWSPWYPFTRLASLLHSHPHGKCTFTHTIHEQMQPLMQSGGQGKFTILPAKTNSVSQTDARFYIYFLTPENVPSANVKFSHLSPD